LFRREILVGKAMGAMATTAALLALLVLVLTWLKKREARG
jgi:ABC-type transport system involved in multi-copper enzyme maturation permease subunit